MAKSKTKRKRMSREEVAELLKAEILSGHYKPGDRLPSREKLAARIPAGYVTIQHGIGVLEEQGFVVSHHGRGTFVTEHPPHLFHYGMWILDEEEQLQRGQNRFHQTLINEAARFNTAHAPQRITVFVDFVHDVVRPGYQRLMWLLQHRQLAGVVVPDLPISLLSSKLIATPGIGLVTAAVPHHHAPGLAHLAPDRKTFLQRAMANLAEQGCRRVAVLTTGAIMDAADAPYSRLAADLATRCGMTIQPYWILPLDPLQPANVRSVVHLLFAPGRDAAQPDGLIIEDDHMVESVGHGLLDAGPRNLPAIIGYCNFPDCPPCVVPYTPLGTDCRSLLANMIDTIDAQVHGRPVETVTMVSPILGSEFDQRDTADPA